MRVPYRNGTVWVDKGCVAFMQKLWAEGYRTIGCCEEAYPGWARIWFYGDHFKRFREEYPESVEGYLPHTVDIPVALLDNSSSQGVS